MITYDSIIIGGGPAGSSAAYAMARAGLNVILVEKEKIPRYKCCAGGIPKKAIDMFDFDFSSCQDSPIRGIAFSWRGRQKKFWGDEKILGWVVKREIFDQLLIELARSAGAQVVEGCRFLDVEDRKNDIQINTSTGNFRGRTLIGADGAGSIVARKLGLMRYFSLGFALETRIKVPDSIQSAKQGKLHFDLGAVPGGYGWIFPLNDYLNIGVATRRSRFRGLKQCLQDYLNREGLLKYSSESSIRGGALSFRNFLAGLVKNHCCLVGDAAGLTDRLTGEGIYPAILSGRIAGQAVENYLKGNAQLRYYQNLINKSLGMNIFLSGLASRMVSLLPHTFYNLVCCNSKRIEKGVALVQGELCYKDLIWRR